MTTKLHLFPTLSLALALPGFAPANQSRSEGTEVVVRSDQVPALVAVRYAWADNPEEANLYSQAGLPAATFHTDAF